MERSAVADPLVGRLLDGRYRITARIARGGMGTVYAGVDLRLDRRVALKVLPTALADDDDVAQRFVREARAAARLTHPAVVGVYDQGDDQGTLFLVMEFIEGGRTLRDLIREQAPLTPGRALALIEQVLQALAAAHLAGIVHRDVKPENVLLGPHGEVKVTDFGLARAVSASTTVTATGGVLMGTVSYLPPEVVVDGTADARADVYAAGVLLFELLTGVKPHLGDSPIQIAYKHVHEDVPPPSTLAAGIPPYLDALVARATARDRDLRPADARVMLQQLGRVRTALAQGITDDANLTSDLSPTVAVLARGAVGIDEVFDQDAFADTTPGPDDALTAPVSVGGPAPGAAVTAGRRPESTLEEIAPTWVSPSQEYAAQEVAVGSSGPAAPQPAPPRRTRRRRRGWIALLVVIVLAATAAFAGWYFGEARFRSTPDVVGLSQASALVTLKRAGLTLDVTRSAYSERVPIGDLISTDPGPGDRVQKGGTVHAVVSKGAERHDVPDVRLMTQAKAVAALTARHLHADPITQAWSETVPVGQVISFTPKAGTPLKRDAKVALVVSKGPQPISIPDYTGKDADTARAALTKLGFVVDPSQRYDDDVPKGKVISESPHAGTGFKGDHIALVTSRGPHLVQVPDVVHDGLTSAEEALRAKGFVPDARKYTPSFGLGIVVSQTPGGDDMAPYGSTVIIYYV